MKKGKITPELLQKIKDSVNLIEVVGEHVVLRKSGANFSGLCPFHQERSPSFSVSEVKQLYHCYGCKKGGDLVSFVMEIHGISFPEAIEELAERGKVPLAKDWGGAGGGTPEEEARRAAQREKLHLLFKLNRFVAAFYHHGLSQSPPARQYFSNRGVSEEQIRSFYLGASSTNWDDLAQHLLNKKAPLPPAQELGLIRPSPKNAPGGIGFFDLFRNRAMFPILDLRGKVVGFGGRSLPDSSEDGPKSDGPKYMNSPESPIYHKSKVAYGLYQAQKYIREKDEVIMVEGYFDVIALHAAGFQNVVATCGTALTPEHLQIFKKFASKVTVLFDGDRAGITATERAMELGLEHGAVLYGASIPGGRDPDEVLFDQKTGKPTPNGVKEMTEILNAASPLLDTRIAEAIVEASGGPEDRTRALKKIATWLGTYIDPVGREIRIQDVAQKLGVSRNLIAQAMGGEPPGARSGSKVPFSRGNPKPQVFLQPPGLGMPPRVGPPPLPKKNNVAPVIRGQVKSPSAGDRVLLRALAWGGPFLKPFVVAGAKLPEDMSLADLFDYVPARAFLAQILGSTPNFEQFVLDPSMFLEDASPIEIDPQVRSILMEASVQAPPVDSSTEGGFSVEDVNGAVHRGTRRLWARFSQQIKAAMEDAELKKDAELHAKLSKDYLDLERKMKEFISFYDEA